jgi:hypothetical protein
MGPKRLKSRTMHALVMLVYSLALACRPPTAWSAEQDRAVRQAAAVRSPLRGLRSPSGSALAQYRDSVLYFNSRLAPEQAAGIARSIIASSNAYGLDARLVMAVIAVESNFNAAAFSPNADEYTAGVARRLRGCLDQTHPRPAGVVTDEHLKLTLACYKAGLGAVKRHRAVPRERRTKTYVRKVMRLYRQMCGGKPAQLPSPSMQAPPKPARRHGAVNRDEPGSRFLALAAALRR